MADMLSRGRAQKIGPIRVPWRCWLSGSIVSSDVLRLRLGRVPRRWEQPGRPASDTPGGLVIGEAGERGFVQAEGVEAWYCLNHWEPFFFASALRHPVVSAPARARFAFERL